MSPAISVVFCTARKDPAIEILKYSMEVQTFRDFEVIVLDELHRKTPFIDVTPPPKKPKMFWNLSASLNAGVKRATGKIIILLQDFIYVPPGGLAKYIERHKEEGPCLVTGIGHQYKEPSKLWTSYPPPLPNDKLVFKDPRKVHTGFYVTQPLIWEANWGSFDKKIWEEIGGFDENYDEGWGWDNCNFSERAQLAGYNIFIDTYNEILCYSHINLFDEQKHRDESPNNMELYQRDSRELHRKQKPYKLNYAD